MKEILDSLMKFILPDAQAGISDQIMKNLNPTPEQVNVNPAPLATQPMDVPEVPDLEQLHPNEIKDYSTGIDMDSYYEAMGELPAEDPVDKEYIFEADREQKESLTRQMTGEEDIKPLRTNNQAKGMLVDSIKEYENAQEMGRVSGPDGELFTVFDVPESPIGEKDIGWGFKVEPEMLTEDKSKWPKVNGIPIDLRKGISRDVANSLLYQEIEKARETCRTQMPNWDNMTPMEKFFWNDLAYNSGPETFNKSPNAVKAAKAGYTAEAAIKSLDFIGSGHKQVKGLFDRRIKSYNKMAQELPGVPEIEEAEWGEQVRVKFAHQIKSTKVSKAFTNKINGSTDGWFTVTKGEKGRKREVYKP